ncbi:MAG: BatA domain-containing protein [Gammaproteobacteria bacterium]
MLLAPLFLLGLLGVGLPLWLHRFARDTRTKEPFASLMLLEANRIHRSREHTLRYWLLLALRISLLLLVVLAFAQPVLPWRTPPLEARDRTLHVIVLDTSLSMQQGARWQRAVEKARSLIDSMRAADQGMLVTADSRVRVVRGPVNQSSADELRTALSAVRPGPARLDYGMLMTSARSWLGTGRPATQLHLITDLQQSATPLQLADLEPPEGVKLVIEDVGVGDAAGVNQYVTSVAPSAQDSNELAVRVGGIAAPGMPRTLTLSVDGKTPARKSLDSAAAGAIQTAAASGAEGAVKGGSSANISVIFTGLELGAGSHRLTLTLEPNDSLPQDDRYFAVIEHREPRALIIGATSAADDVSYFAAAVGALTSPHLTVERTGADAISQRALADYSTLVVSDVGVLSDPSANAIQRYLEGGGSVLMTLGPRAAQRDTLPLSGHPRASRNLNAQGNNDTTPIRVAAVEQSHPALRDPQGWRTVRFFRYVPIDPLPDDTVLIRFEDGRPLLIERHVGAGRLLVLTSPLDREWNDLAIHALFVRFIGEAARYLTAAAAAPNTTVGKALPTGTNARNGAQIFDPEGRRVLALSDTAEQPRLMAGRVGFYEVRGGGRSDWIAVNSDPRESDLARMPSASVQQWQKLETGGQPTPARLATGAKPVRENGASTRGSRNDSTPGIGPAAGAHTATATATAATDELDTSRSLKALWPWLLLIAVTLAFIEPLVANSHLNVRRGVTP